MTSTKSMTATLLGLLWIGTGPMADRIAFVRDARGEEHRVNDLRTIQLSCPDVSIDEGHYGLILPIVSLVSLDKTGQVRRDVGQPPVPTFKAVFASSDGKETSVSGMLGANGLRGDTAFGAVEFEGNISSLRFESAPVLAEVRRCDRSRFTVLPQRWSSWTAVRSRYRTFGDAARRSTITGDHRN